MKKIKIGIIGCGTIGSALARVLCRELRASADLRSICDRQPERAERLKRRLGSSVQVTSIEKLIERSDLVIEAASASIAADVASQALARDKKVLVMSVGGLLRDTAWLGAARKSRGRLWIPSGALAGMDGLLAAREGRIRKVKLVTRKPPQALESAPFFKKKKFPEIARRRAVCIFRGSARQAVTGFPQNINVAAVLSLAGIGGKKTRVEIWSSPKQHSNQHEVTIEGDFGKITTVTRNLPSPQNPKTSYLAILSAVATLKMIFSKVKLGT